MAEPIYLNYGQNQIDLLAFLEAVANNVQNYVALQPWSNKRKELFMKAYSDIMSKGVTGASNANGVWSVQHNNGQIDLASKSKKEQEMYGEAAYFIQLLMSSITSKAVEDLKKEELPIFNNEQFNTGLQNYISTNLYGGMDFNQSRWNDRDSLDKYGIRSTTERAKILAQTLRGYANSIESDKYSFEGSPYKDIDTLKTNLNAAADALERGDWNNDTLYKIGIDPEQYLATGVNDIVTIGDKLIRRGDVPGYYQQLEADKLKAELDAKAKEELAKKLQAMQVIKNNPFSKVRIRSGFNNMHGWSPNQIANQYTIATLNDKLNELSGRSDWTPEEQSLAAGAYKHSPKVPISQEEYNTLKAMTRFKDASKSRFSKILGVDGMIYDSATGSLIMAGDTATNGLTDWLAGKSNKDSREKYLKSSKDGLTSAELEELASIGFDIASIVDPEMISAAGLALAGSGLRHHALILLPGGPSTSDKWWQAADYGLSILGSIPFLGDSVLAFRVINNLKKAIVPLGIVMAGANVPQAAKAAYNKVVNGQDLTILDWRAIGAVLTAAVGYGRGRQMSKRAEALRKTGGTTSKTTKEYAVKTDKGEIKISEQQAKDLEKSLKPHGNDVAKKTEVLRQNEAVKKAAKEQGINLEEASITTESSIRNGKWSPFKNTPEIVSSPKTESIPGSRRATLRAMSEFNKNHGWLARKGLAEQDWIFRHTGGYNSKPSTGLWQNIKDFFGKSKWDDFGKTDTQATTNKNTVTNNNNVADNVGPLSSKEPTKIYNTPLTVESGRHHLNRHAQLETALENRILKIEDKKFHHKPSIDKDIKLDVGSEHLEVSVTNGKGTKHYRLRSKGEKSIVYPTTSNVETLQKLMSEVIKRQHKKLDVDKIKELRKLFGLKHGGTIDKQRIQRYKEFIKK